MFSCNYRRGVRFLVLNKNVHKRFAIQLNPINFYVPGTAMYQALPKEAQLREKDKVRL